MFNAGVGDLQMLNRWRFFGRLADFFTVVAGLLGIYDLAKKYFIIKNKFFFCSNPCTMNSSF